MCGIVGYLGNRQAVPVLLDGLRRLEYRGYDSAGVAIVNPQGLAVVRAVGKLDNLTQATTDEPLVGCLGIGHTRWATHGRPNQRNAHPHRSGPIAVVHNGIIENHLELKAQLIASGVKFESDTDTEIVAHLVDQHWSKLTDVGKAEERLLQAVQLSLAQLRGAYALAILCEEAPDALIVAKNASPLVLGIGNEEVICASDIPALLNYTRDVIFLEDGEVALLTRGAVNIKDSSGNAVERSPQRIAWSPVQAEKGGYKHFMLKEIFEQPRAIEDTLRGRFSLETGEVVASELGIPVEIARNVDRVYFVACGTSYHASLAGRHWIEQLARLPSQAELASEVRYRAPVFTERDLIVAVSQSGETADTLAAVQSAQAQGAKVLALTNVLDSAIARIADGAFYTHAGPEIGVASTKAFTTQLVAMLLLATFLVQEREVLSKDASKKILGDLVEVPSLMRRCLSIRSEVQDVAKRWHQTEHMLFLGRGLGFPLALEGALKLKEISYAHAEGYAAGEMKHGPIALIDEEMPVVVIAPQDSNYEKTLSNLQEVKARDGQVLAIATEGDQQMKSLTEDIMVIPNCSELVMPLLASVPLQLLAYYTADFKGTDVDQPRNLAKTVTVE
ncbi:MAG: glutamine--fructose-6-phosphate transaminase (isomerizing) [Polyangiaceae bacterium]|nr:glutamine--fructose-6-phosphate transaminase (isomerizing) [Polyangiaceae bacterium]